MNGTPRLRIRPDGVKFTDAVLADLIGIRSTAAGRALFGRLRAAEVSLTIEKPDAPTEPPNAWTRWADAPSRLGKEIVIAYDPADWPLAADPAGLTSTDVLLGRLSDAADWVATG